MEISKTPQEGISEMKTLEKIRYCLDNVDSAACLLNGLSLETELVKDLTIEEVLLALESAYEEIKKLKEEKKGENDAT